MSGRPASDSAILTGLEDPRLLDAMDVNITEALAIAVSNMGGEVYRGPEMTRFISGLPVSLFNGVALARLPEGGEDALIAETMERFKARAVPMIWWDGPLTRPVDLGARLIAHGLTRRDEEPGMVVDITALAPMSEIPGVTITRVTDLAGLEEWARTGAVGMGIPPEGASVFLDMFGKEVAAPDSPWLFHLAALDGAPVATSLTLLHSGVAGIFLVGTAPYARGRGIGGEMTRAGLLDAGRRGYRVGVLQASSMGYRVYRRLGFETVYIYHEHHWAPPGGGGQ